MCHRCMICGLLLLECLLFSDVAESRNTFAQTEERREMDTPRAASSGDEGSDDDNASQLKSKNFLRFSANSQTWASEYPFPVFIKKTKKDADASDAAVDAYGDADEEDHQHDDSSDDDADRATVRIKAPHPMASDTAFEQHEKSWAQHASECLERVATSSMRNASALSFSHNSSNASLRKRTNGEVLEWCPPVSGDEAAALLTLAGGGCAAARRGVIDMKRLDLSWLGQKRTPGCHLHLGNLHLRIDGAGGDDTTAYHDALLNSPRSAVVLLRNGISVQALLRRPWARRRFTHTESFGALDTLSIVERREYSFEKLRQTRLTECVRDYSALCAVTSQDEIVSMCEAILGKRVQVQRMERVRPPSPSVSRAKTPSIASAAASIALSRPGSALSAQKERLLEHSSVSETTLLSRPLVVRQRLQSATADQTLAAIADRERRNHENRKALEAKRVERLVLQAGKTELIRAQQIATVGTTAYRNLLLEERSRQREDAARAVGVARMVTSIALQDARRHAKIVEDQLYRSLAIKTSHMK